MLTQQLRLESTRLYGSFQQAIHCGMRYSKSIPDLLIAVARSSHLKGNLWINHSQVMPWESCHAPQFSSMSVVACHGRPFKIAHSIVRSICVNVINYLSFLWSSDKRRRYKSMYSNSHALGLVAQINGVISPSLDHSHKSRGMAHPAKVADLVKVAPRLDRYRAPLFGIGCHVHLFNLHG